MEKDRVSTLPGREQEKSARLRQAAAALEEFARAARQASQYPSRHPVAEAAVERARLALLKLFSTPASDCVRLVTSPRGLLLNGDNLPAAGPGLDWLNEGLRRRLTKTILLRRALETSEVEDLLELLAGTAEEIVEGGGVPKWLAARGVRHIEAEEQDYRRLLRESEAAMLQMVAEQEAGPVREMVRLCMSVLEKRLESAVEKAPAASSDSESDENGGTQNLFSRLALLADFVSSAPSGSGLSSGGAEFLPAGWEAFLEAEIPSADLLAAALANLIQAGFGVFEEVPQESTAWEENVARAIWRLEPELRARLFRVPVTISPESEEALSRLAGRFSPQQIVEEIIFAHPMAITGETSSSLGRLFRRLMPTPARQLEIEPLLKARLLQEGMSHETYRNVVGLLLDSLAKEQMMKDKQPGFHLRKQEAKEAEGSSEQPISDLLASLAPGVVERARSEMLIELLGGNYSAAEYSGLCSELASGAQGWREKGEDELGLQLFRALAGETQAENRSSSQRLIASSALGRLGTPEFTSWLAQMILRASPQEKADLVNLLALLGEGAGKVLLGLVFAEKDEALIRVAALALCRQAESIGTFALQTGRVGFSRALGEGEGGFRGERGLAHLFANALAQGAPARVIRVIRILLSSQRPQVLAVVRGGLRHRESRMRVEMMRALGEFKPAEAERLLLAGLEDSCWQVRAEACRALGEMGGQLSREEALRATERLGWLAKQAGFNSRTHAVRLAAIEAVGRLGQEEAVPLLVGLLEEKGWFFRRGRERLRSAAAAALAEIPFPAAAEALRQGCASRKAALANICQGALTRWRRKWQGQDLPAIRQAGLKAGAAEPEVPEGAQLPVSSAKGK